MPPEVGGGWYRTGPCRCGRLSGSSTTPGYYVSEQPCPFCTLPTDRVWLANGHAVAFRDGFPISPGHTLVIPRVHYPCVSERVGCLVGVVRRFNATVLHGGKTMQTLLIDRFRLKYWLLRRPDHALQAGPGARIRGTSWLDAMLF